MKELSIRQKRHLRRLTEAAYEKDLTKCVTDLNAKFDAWKNKNLSVWDLNQAIHEYHDDIARELYKSYTMNDPIFTVAFGVCRGVIKLEDVEESCKESVEKLSAAMLRNLEM